METLIDISMAIGPVLGYVHQCHIISKTKSVGTFSIDICGILLFANILRLNFYVFTKYAIPLLWQSINMIIVQICLVYICTKWRNKKTHDESSQSNEKQKIDTQNVGNFWRWHQFPTYLLFILLFTFVSFSITLLFKQFDFEPYGVFVGLTALLSESVLIVPQIIRNFRKKCTQGLSYLLVGFNLFGDIFKLVYFIIKVQAFQFILCGIVQVCLDSFVIFQIFLYRKNKLVQQKDHHKSVVQNNQYNFDDAIKTDTEKNFDDIEMMENAIQKQSSTDDTDQNYGSERPSHIKQKEQDVYVHTQEWGMKYAPTVQKKEQTSHFQERLNTIPEEKNQQKQIKIEKNNGFKQAIDKNNLQIKKATSQQNNVVHTSQQFFEAHYVLPPKSMQNVIVLG